MMTIYKLSRLLLTLCIAISMMASVHAYAASIDAELGENEAKMGDEAAAEIAKEYKLSDNAADLKRVRDIGNKIAAIANKKEIAAVYGLSKITPFNFEFNIIEDKDINAFCVPGGRIYVYRGLLDFVESDDELAGVIAHEIVHASHHHMVFLIKKQASLQNTMAIALLATMLAGARSTDINNIVLGVQVFQIARLNGYGMQAERDSDNGAITYAHDAGYNPVGLLTFLERLARRPELIDYGIYRSHPLDADRVNATKNIITKMGLPINRRATTKAIKAEVRIENANGFETAVVVVQDKIIYRPAPGGGKSSAERANEIAGKINEKLDSGLKLYELKTDTASGTVVVQNQVLLVVSDADAKLMGMTPAQVAKGLATAIRDIVWKQMVDTMH